MFDIEAQTGAWDGASFDVAATATLELRPVAAVSFTGTFNGVGAGQVAVTGDLVATNAVWDFDIDGFFNVTSGDLRGTSSVPVNRFITFNGSSPDFEEGTLVNEGTVNIEPGNNSMFFSGNATLDNDGLLLVADGVTFTASANPPGTKTIDNSGTIRKETGPGTSVINSSYRLDSSGGTFDVDGGILRLDSTAGTFAGATFDVAAGAILDVSTGDAVGFTGSFDSAGTGEVLVTQDWVGTAAVLNFPDGVFAVRSGDLEGTNTVAAGSFLRFDGSSPEIGSGELTNLGTVVIEPSNDSFFMTETVTLDNDGLVEVAGDADFTTSVAAPKIVENSGTFRKSSGPAITSVSGAITFDNQNGVIESNEGLLDIQSNTGTWTGADLRPDGGDIDLSVSAGVSMGGTLTGSGAGEVFVTGVFNGNNVTLDLPSGMLSVFSADLTGTTTVASGAELTFAGSSPELRDGTLTNDGTIVVEPSNATLFFTNAAGLINNGLVDVINASSITTSGVGPKTIDNNVGATFQKLTVGTVNISGSIVFTNNGTVAGNVLCGGAAC